MGRRIGDYEVVTIVTDEPWSENCYLVRQISSSQMVIIDPGGAADRIAQAVRDNGGDPKAILITHAHHDHVGAVAELQRHFSIPCFLHRADNRLLRQAHTYALVFAARNMEPLSEVCLFEGSSSPKIDHWPIQTIHTPGHSPGSVCYCFGGFVFTGDTLLYQHVGRADTPGSDPAQVCLSVDRLLHELTEETVILSGHGRSWTIGEARVWWLDVRQSPPQYKRFGGI